MWMFANYFYIFKHILFCFKNSKTPKNYTSSFHSKLTLASAYDLDQATEENTSI
jgi:hypothetical protein